MRKDVGCLYDGTNLTALSDQAEERGARAASCEFWSVGGLAHSVGLVPLPNIEIYLHYSSLSDCPRRLAHPPLPHLDDQQSEWLFAPPRGLLSPLARHFTLYGLSIIPATHLSVPV